MSEKDRAFEIMDMNERYPSNSKSNKTDISNRKVERVTKDDVQVVERSRKRKIRDILLADSSVSIKEYIITEIVIPRIKDIIYDIGVGSLGLSLFGEADVLRSKGTKKNGYEYDKVSFATPYHTQERKKQPKRRGRIDYRELRFNSRIDAEDVLCDMRDYISQYGSVSLLTYYELAGVKPEYITFTDDEYGWFDLSRVSVEYDRHTSTYVLTLPKATPID